MDVTYEAQRSWPRKRQKIFCPECGLSGYIGGDWVNKHANHVTCTCGQRVTERGLPNHRVGKARHGIPCP